MGTEFSKFIFQASFCTTVTTIVSGKYVKETVEVDLIGGEIARRHWQSGN